MSYFPHINLMSYSVILQLNTGQLAASDVGRDLNVEKVWLQGITGCGSVVAVVDDGTKIASTLCLLYSVLDLT